jgi:hypothetical protein
LDGAPFFSPEASLATIESTRNISVYIVKSKVKLQNVDTVPMLYKHFKIMNQQEITFKQSYVGVTILAFE